MRCILPLLLLTGACQRPPHVPRHPAELTAAARVERGGVPIPLDALWDDVRQHDVVCVGEQHDAVLHHRFQRLVLRAVIAGGGGRDLGLGFEMFQRPFQPLLDVYARGGIDEATLQRESEWEERWGFGWSMYEPLLQDAHDYEVDLLALNAPREATRAIARRGLEGIPAALRGQVARDLDLTVEPHQRFFWSATGLDPDQPAGGGHGGMNPERMYAAQVAWDETMAETSAAWLGPSDSGRQLVVIAGNGHCHRSAIVDRVVRRRPGTSALSVLLTTDGDDGLPETQADYRVTLPRPARRDPGAGG